MAVDLTKFISLNAGVQELTPGTSNSTGGPDAGNIAALNSAGYIDKSAGGTGIDSSGVTDGQLLIGNSSGNVWDVAALTAGSNITITPGSGSITIASTSGSSSLTPATKTANFNAAAGFFYSVDVATAGATVTATLPDATAVSGQNLVVQISTAPGGHAVIFATTSSQNINGTAAGSLNGLLYLNQAYTFVSDGAGWWVVDYVAGLGTGNVGGHLSVSNGGTSLGTLTAHNVMLGEGTGAVGFAAPGTAGIPLVSAGASADPSFSTAVVAGGGTGAVTLAAHGVVIGNGTSAVNVTTAGTSGQVLTSNGASSDPTFQAAPYAFNTMTVTVSETIAAGAMINLWNNTGLNVRNADNTSTAKQAHGFALTGASSGTITVAVGSGPNTQQSGLTVGVNYFLGAAGAVTATAPSSSGDIVMPIGVAVSATELQVILGQVTSIA